MIDKLSDFYSGKRIAITGGNGFLGKAVFKKLLCLLSNGADIVIPPKILTSQAITSNWFFEQKPQIVFHLAGVVGGIGENIKRPAELFYENLQMGLNVIHSAQYMGVEKLLVVGSACSYPEDGPFLEEYLFSGRPNETNAPYGIAKRALAEMCQAYRTQYNFNSVYLILANLYGPGGHYDKDRSHVIPAMIAKIAEAKEQGRPFVELWGTGRVTRDFLYVEDAAEAIIQGMARVNDPAPVNISGENEISMDDVAHKIASLLDYKGQIVFDTSRPDGQPSRRLDSTRAKTLLNFRPYMDFDKGLELTIQDYLSTQRIPA